jgi:hypothetical protein
MAAHLTELWMEHSSEVFPKGYGGKDVEGICVTLLDSDVSGCIHSYMKTEKGRLSFEHFYTLQKSKDELVHILKYLDGEAFEYFSRLHDMCSLILKEAKVA